MDNPESENWFIGHIHSHNTMGVFFSGTDMSELNDNSASHNFYLSLIVNNFMDFTAKVAFRGEIDCEIKDIPYYAMNENGDKYVIETKKLQFKKTKMYTYDCDIISPVDSFNVPKVFAEKVDKIINPPKKQFQQPQHNGWDYDKHVKQYNKYENRGKQFELPWYKQPEHIVNGKSVIPPDEEDFNNSFNPQQDEDLPLDIFIKTLFGFGETPKETEELENLLDDIVEMEINGLTLAQSILDVYVKAYEKCYPDLLENTEAFIEISGSVIDTLEDMEEVYPVICPTIGAIKELISKFEDYELTRE